MDRTSIEKLWDVLGVIVLFIILLSIGSLFITAAVWAWREVL